MTTPALGPFNIDRIFLAVEKQRERLRRSTSALEQAQVPYAVIGGSAVASWISRVDESAVRFTQDVDILLRRADLPGATTALEAAGFRYSQSDGNHVFLDGPDGRVRDAVHVVFAAAKVRPDDLTAVPDVNESEQASEYRVVSLLPLVTMKLTSCRDKDRTHLRDLIDVGMIDASWTSRVPGELAGRLQELLDNPDG